jgi:hypothetical protein
LFDQGVVFAYPASPWQRGTNELERAAAPLSRPSRPTFAATAATATAWPRSSQRERRTPDASLTTLALIDLRAEPLV